jgi:hypothetical protein
MVVSGQLRATAALLLRREPSYQLDGSWVGSEDTLGVVEERNYLVPAGNRTQIDVTDWATAAP